MNIQLRKSSIKDIKKIPSAQKERIEKKLIELQDFPNISNIKKLSNFDPAYRCRVGDYRILFDIEDDTIYIGRILHRKESYKK